MGIVEPQSGGGKAAIGSRNNVLAPDEPGEAHDTFGDQFRMFDEIGGVADYPRYEDLSG